MRIIKKYEGSVLFQPNTIYICFGLLVAFVCLNIFCETFLQAIDQSPRLNSIKTVLLLVGGPLSYLTTKYFTSFVGMKYTTPPPDTHHHIIIRSHSRIM